MIQLSRRTVALALAALMAVAALATASFVLTLTRTADAGVFPGNFSDTPPWIADHATWLANQGVASGFDNGTFKPNDNITRGQAAFWFGNYNNTVELVKEQMNPASGTSFTMTAVCPPGKRVVSGGGFISQSSVHMYSSHPPNATSWRASFRAEDNVAVDPNQIVAWALCMPDTIPN